MQRLARWMFNAAWGFSLLMAAILIVLWIRSYTKAGSRDLLSLPGGRTVGSEEGRLGFSLPPRGWDVIEDDPVAGKIIDRLSNDDVILLSPEVPVGEYRPGSAAWELFERMKDFDGREHFLPVERLLLRALDDPKKFMAAQMLLSVAWDMTEGDGFHGPDRFSRPNFGHATEVSDYMNWRNARYNWHSDLDLEIVVIWHSWLIAIALLLPISRVSKPRKLSRSAWRWAFNFLALLSLFLAGLGATGWWQSTRGGFAMSTYLRTNRERSFYVRSFIHSTDGKMIFTLNREKAFIEYADFVFVQGLIPLTPFHFPTFWFKSSSIPNGLDNENGWQATLVTPYWAIVAGSLALPAFWLSCARKKIAPGFCVKCGYDLRATPNRCPECGSAGVAGVSAGESLVAGTTG